MAVPEVVLGIAEGALLQVGLGTRQTMENGCPDALPELLSGL